MADTEPEIVAALLDPEAYPRRPRSVELRETHISWVFLAGDHAYKLKKPLVLPFLDYGTLERRREMCHREVQLNRRLAPEIYLGVVAVARRGTRFEIAPEDDREAVEYAVEMRRVEADRSLAALAGAGELAPGHLDAVAVALARFHSEAAVAQPEDRDVGIAVAALEENLETIRAAGADVIGVAPIAAAEGFTRAWLARRGGELAARADAGLIRDCHGDLRAEHVIVPRAGDVYVYDCVEFNPALRLIDVAADFAFLVMDLARLGVDWAAERLTGSYREAGGDPGDDRLLTFFAAYRAWVRAKVACLPSAELPATDHGRGAAEAEARELFRLGRRFGWRAREPAVLAVAGVAGSGKTTLARELAELSGWPHLDSDRVRKRLAGVAPGERAGAAAYGVELTLRTYRELGLAAREALASESGAIVDASFHRRDERDAFRSGLGGAGRLVFLECTAPRDILHRRVHRRERDPARVSDAGVEIVDLQLARAEPLDEVPAGELATVLTERPAAELTSEAERLLDGS